MDSTDFIFVATSQDVLFQETRDNLVRLGYQNCARFSSGKAATEFIKFNPARTIVIDTEVEDLSPTEFVAALREVRQAAFLRVLVISTDRTENFVLGVISAGCSGLVLRPYTLAALEKHLPPARPLGQGADNDRESVDQADAMIAQGRFEDAIDDLTRVVSQKDDLASQLFFQGCQYLVEKKWSEAIFAFNQSLARNQTFIKAYEGLAHAYLGKNDLEKHRLYLQKAADEYAKMNNFEKVKKIFVEIIKYDVNAPNPYNTLGIRLRQEKQYKEAIQAYFQAISLSPKDENIHYNMAKAYYCDNQQHKSLECLKLALSLSPEHSEALKMFRMLTGVPWEENPKAPWRSMQA
jgi:Flp pilus assembly protein TadD